MRRRPVEGSQEGELEPRGIRARLGERQRTPISASRDMRVVPLTPCGGGGHLDESEERREAASRRITVNSVRMKSGSHAASDSRGADACATKRRRACVNGENPKFVLRDGSKQIKGVKHSKFVLREGSKQIENYSQRSEYAGVQKGKGPLSTEAAKQGEAASQAETDPCEPTFGESLDRYLGELALLLREESASSKAGVMVGQTMQAERSAGPQDGGCNVPLPGGPQIGKVRGPGELPRPETSSRLDESRASHDVVTPGSEAKAEVHHAPKPSTGGPVPRRPSATPRLDWGERNSVLEVHPGSPDQGHCPFVTASLQADESSRRSGGDDEKGAKFRGEKLQPSSISDLETGRDGDTEMRHETESCFAKVGGTTQGPKSLSQRLREKVSDLSRARRRGESNARLAGSAERAERAAQREVGELERAEWVRTCETEAASHIQAQWARARCRLRRRKLLAAAVQAGNERKAAARVQRAWQQRRGRVSCGAEQAESRPRGKEAAYARFLQHMWRRRRAKPGLTMRAMWRPVTRYACAQGQNLAPRAEFEAQQERAEAVLGWYRAYVEIVRNLQDKRPVVVVDGMCGGGGTSEGVRRGGGGSRGVDLEPQEDYVRRFGRTAFEQGDATDVSLLRRLRDSTRAIGGMFSPPCQYYSTAKAGASTSQLPLIEITRDAAEELGWLYSIENVLGANKALGGKNH